MTWVLVLYIYIGGGGDPGIVQGYIAPRQRVEVVMPSETWCREVAALNTSSNAECWAKPKSQ